MHSTPPIENVIVKRGEKEARLSAFLRAALSECGRDTTGNYAPAIRVLARSLESPVMRTLSRLLKGEPHAVARARCILFSLDANDDGTGRTPASGIEFVQEVRLIRDVRLIDAHELLVIDAVTCWVGDSIRRAPAQCDSAETFAISCTRTAGYAALSFERIWERADGVTSRIRRSGVEALAGIAATQSVPPVAATSRN